MVGVTKSEYFDAGLLHKGSYAAGIYAAAIEQGDHALASEQAHRAARWALQQGGREQQEG